MSVLQSHKVYIFTLEHRNKVALLYCNARATAFPCLWVRIFLDILSQHFESASQLKHQSGTAPVHRH